MQFASFEIYPRQFASIICKVYGVRHIRWDDEIFSIVLSSDHQLNKPVLNTIQGRPSDPRWCFGKQCRPWLGCDSSYSCHIGIVFTLTNQHLTRVVLPEAKGHGQRQRFMGILNRPPWRKTRLSGFLRGTSPPSLLQPHQSGCKTPVGSGSAVSFSRFIEPLLMLVHTCCASQFNIVGCIVLFTANSPFSKNAFDLLPFCPFQDRRLTAR
jgi:hypothetical protein